MSRSLVVPKSTMDAVDESQSRLLKVPDDAKVVGHGSKQKALWTELFEIVETEVEEDVTDAGMAILIYKANFRVPNDTPYPTNLGRQHYERMRVNTDALDALANGTLSKNDGQIRMSFMSIAKLKNLIIACGLPFGDDADFTEFFDGDGAPSALIGGRVGAKIKQKIDDEAPEGKRQEVTRFISEADLEL